MVRRHRNARRIAGIVGGAVVGLVVHTVVPGWLHGATRFVAAYDAGVLTLLASVLSGLSADPERTRVRAEQIDGGRNLLFVVVLGAVVVGLVAAVAIVGHGPKVQNATEKWAAYGLGLAAIALGWLLVHTIYAFRYAHLYWFDANADGEPGGITFPGTPRPSDHEFLYLAFTIGVSFAVSDPQITASSIRREIIGHAVISFAYNSLIIGMVINLFAGIFAAPAAGGGGS